MGLYLNSPHSHTERRNAYSLVPKLQFGHAIALKLCFNTAKQSLPDECVPTHARVLARIEAYQSGGTHPVRSRYKVTTEDGCYFITSTLVEWLPVFTSKPYFDIMIDSLNFCRTEKKLQLFGYVILDNHFRLVIAGPNLVRTITDLKKFTAVRPVKGFCVTSAEMQTSEFPFSLRSR